MDEFAERMKKYEHDYEGVVPRSSFLAIRADGQCFANFTKGFQKPFDVRIASAMISAAEALYDAFNASVVYTCSDEITVSMMLRVY